MGDDLYIAREFSNAALADISAISAMKSSQSDEAIEQMSLKLAHLQSGAKRLRARAIYQSAQVVINGLTPRIISEDNFTARLSALSNLVAQYADGLSEIEAAQAREDVLVENTADAQATPNFEDLHSVAKTTLAEVMPLARVGEISPLQVLMDYDPKAPPKVQIEPKVKSAPDFVPNPQFSAQTTQIPLEYVLRDAIQDALSIARMSGKTISISYDVRQDTIAETAIIPLERRLCEGLRALILQSLPQDGIGHIDINLQGKNMVICSKHKAPRLLPQSLKTHETATGCEIIVPLVSDIRIPEPAAPSHEAPHSATDDEPTTPFARQPMITDKTEGELRAQLKALLDNPDIDAQQNAAELHMEDNIIVMTDEATKKAQTDKVKANNIGTGL